jgi:hypothetical protein
VSALPCTLRGWLGALLAALLFAALVADVAHRSTIEHAVCAEHGELTHIDGTAAAHPNADEPGFLSATPLEGNGASHEHCALGRVHRDALELALAEPAIALVPPAPLADAWILARELPARVALGAAWARGPPERA